MADATEFLYSGANAIQTGVNAGTIKPQRAAVLRGHVSNRQGGPIAGVRVSVVDHTELGHTDTQADGGFDLAVNGGGPLTLRFERTGYIDAQRLVEETPWEDYAPVDDVVLVPYEDHSSVVDLTSDAANQIARSDTVTDSEGSRSSTLLFDAGTSATMELPNGSTQPLQNLTVRSTEYTIGSDGLAAMPASSRRRRPSPMRWSCRSIKP